MTARTLCCLLLAGLLAGCADTGSPQRCKVNLVADLKLLPGRHQPIVEATINNHKAAFVIDTGASMSMLAENAPNNLDISLDRDRRMTSIIGVGGTTMASIADIHHLGLGHGFARDVSMPLAGRYGPPIDGVPVVGLFGADFMANYDIDLDLPRHRFRMYRLVDCGSDLAPLDAPFFEVPFSVEETKIMLDVKVNDKPLRAVLDTGATNTMIPTWEARRIGVARSDLAAEFAGKAIGVDENRVELYAHRFASLQVGDEDLRNFHLGVADMAIDQMLLGDDFLHFNEVWISYPLQKLYIHPSTDNPIVHVTQ